MTEVHSEMACQELHIVPDRRIGLRLLERRNISISNQVLRGCVWSGKFRVYNIDFARAKHVHLMSEEARFTMVVQGIEQRAESITSCCGLGSKGVRARR